MFDGKQPYTGEEMQNIAEDQSGIELTDAEKDQMNEEKAKHPEMSEGDIKSLLLAQRNQEGNK